MCGGFPIKRHNKIRDLTAELYWMKFALVWVLNQCTLQPLSRRCVMSESSYKCNIIQFHSTNFIIALAVCHAQIARFS